MAYKPQNINTIANTLLSLGGNKETIVGVLVNMREESGFDPMVEEYGRENTGFYPPSYGWTYRHGVGLVQLSYTPANKQIYDYNQSHSEAESIQYQCAMLFEDGLQSWANSGYSCPRSYGSVRDFWANVHGVSARELAGDWYALFERGSHNFATHMDAGRDRYDRFYNEVAQHISWDGNVGGGDISGPSTGDGDEGEQEETVRKLTLQECLAFLDKARPTNNGGSTTDPVGPDTPSPQPPGDATDGQQRVWALWEEGRNAGHTYSQDYRTQWPKHSDCSAFVTRCVNAYLNLGEPSELYNTDTLHDYIESLGWRCIFEGNKWDMDVNDNQEADIIITGVRGQSIGDGGHTLWVCDSAGTTIESTGVPATPPYGDGNDLCKSTVKNQRDVWLIAQSYWYRYRRS